MAVAVISVSAAASDRRWVSFSLFFSGRRVKATERETDHTLVVSIEGYETLAFYLQSLVFPGVVLY